MAEITKGTRVRVNITTTSKGFYSWDHTVEMTDSEEDPAVVIGHMLAYSDVLERECQRRYGSKQDQPKEKL